MFQASVTKVLSALTLSKLGSTKDAPDTKQNEVHEKPPKDYEIQPVDNSSQPDANIISQYLKLPPKDAMQSLTKVYRVGNGPSSSHTIAPKRAAERFLKMSPLFKDGAKRYTVTLYGSLAETGKGHLTDQVILSVLGADHTTVIFERGPIPEPLQKYVNPMIFRSLDDKDNVVKEYTAWSVGGGSVIDQHNAGNSEEHYKIYPLSKFAQLREWCDAHGKDLWEYVFEQEPEIFSPTYTNDHEDPNGWLWKIWAVMKNSIHEGLNTTDECVPGPLKYKRRAKKVFAHTHADPNSRLMLMAYTLAVSEQNASAGLVVTAPTCGSCGVLPGLLRFLQKRDHIPDDRIIKALAVAGIIGNIVRANASVSGADVGCQGEVGVASAMAAGAAAYLLGGGIAAIERAAEMALEGFLGLTCCPVLGLVQVPCIDRNIAGSTRALDSAQFAVMMPDTHLISFDEVVFTMLLTGRDMKNEYKETARGGEALTYKLDEAAFDMKPEHRLALMQGKAVDIEDALGNAAIDKWHKEHKNETVKRVFSFFLSFFLSFSLTLSHSLIVIC